MVMIKQGKNSTKYIKKEDNELLAISYNSNHLESNRRA